MNKKHWLLGVLSIITVGCAAPVPVTYDHPTKALAEKQRDHVECLATANQAAYGAGNWSSDRAIRSAIFQNARDQYFAMCLESRGWRAGQPRPSDHVSAEPPKDAERRCQQEALFQLGYYDLWQDGRDSWWWQQALQRYQAAKGLMPEDPETPGSRVRIFVASLSEQGDLLSQWRGYCPNGAGYSIGFDASALRHEAEMQGFRLVPCIYDDQTQCEEIEKVLTEFMESERWAQALGDLGNDQVFRNAIVAWLECFALIAPMLKDPSFHEEREWRLISQPIWPGDPSWNVRPGRSMLIPYVPIKLTASGGYLPLDEIIVGPTPHKELACMAVGDWLDHEGFSRKLPSIPWGVRSSKIPYYNW